MIPSTSMWSGDVSQVTILVGALFFITLAALQLCKKQRAFQVPARDISKGHRWCYTGLFSTQPVYCNRCELLINDGFRCDSCGIWADEACLQKANHDLPCKDLAVVGPKAKHHWIKGNLPGGSICAVCDEECCSDTGLSNFRCCWCQHTVHTKCLTNLGDICDMGRLKDFVVPPNCIQLRMVGWKGRRHLVVSEVRPPDSVTWSPLIVIANRKSGSNDGETILQAFRAILNPAQVIDLHDLPPESGLEWCNLIPNHTCRIVVAGGDGTIGWVMDTINKLGLKPLPHVGIIPMGTGNDLSRVLGWGDGSCGSNVNVAKLLESIEVADVVQLDRWKVKITPLGHLGIRMPSKEFVMNNYTSIGVDALVTLNFHKTRESSLYLVSSRMLNKFLFLSYGTKDIWERECKNLHKKVELYLDNNRMEVPEVEAIVILNIACWGAGVRPWELGADDNTPPQHMDDGTLEVFGIYSSFHIAQLQVGLSEPVRIGQARSVRLKLLEKMPMQIDGEPWEQPPSDIEVSFYGQALMLACSS